MPNPPPGYKPPTELDRSVLGNFANAVEAAPLRAGLGLADTLSRQENANTERTRSFLTESRNRNQAAMQGSLGTASQMFGQYADLASGQHLSRVSGLANYLGGAGITGGGLAADLFNQSDIARQAQISEGMRDISIKEANRRGQMASDMFLQDLSLAPYLNQSPSMLLLDQVNGTAGWMQDFALGRAQVNESRENRRQAERDSERAMWGSIGGGLLGALGGFLL